MKHPFKIERDRGFCKKLGKQVNLLNRVNTNLGLGSTIVETIPLCDCYEQCKADGCLLDKSIKKKEIL